MADKAEKKERTPEDRLDDFLKRSGYKRSDVDGQNDRLGTFLTTNGGKYQITRKGQLRTIKGPAYPKFVDPAVAE